MPETPDEAQLKEAIAKEAGVDVANVTIAVYRTGGETVDLAGKMLTDCHVGTLLRALREHAPKLIRMQACRDRTCSPCCHRLLR